MSLNDDKDQRETEEPQEPPTRMIYGEKEERDMEKYTIINED